jgi:hypothetical protein
MGALYVPEVDAVAAPKTIGAARAEIAVTVKKAANLLAFISQAPI